MTNEEYIKSMTTEELAIFLQRIDCSLCPAKTYTCNCSDRYLYCLKKIRGWLKKEKEE